MLAGVVNAPSADDPVTNPGNARARLEHVIARMVAVGYLTMSAGTAGAWRAARADRGGTRQLLGDRSARPPAPAAWRRMCTSLKTNLR